MKLRSLLVLLFIVLLSLLVTGCDTLNIPSGTNKDQESILASGVIEANQVNIAPEIPGRIKEIHVTEGSKVSAGDLIFSLENDLLAAQKSQATAQYDAALAMQESAKAALLSTQAFRSGAEANLTSVKIQYEQVLAQVHALDGDYRVADWIEIPLSQIELPAWYFQQPEKITAAEEIVALAWEDYQAKLENYQNIAKDVGDDDYLEAELRLANAQAAFQIADALRDRQISYFGRQEIREQVDNLFNSAETELEEAQQAYFQILADPQYDEILEARAKVSVTRERYDLARDYLADQYRGAYSYDVQIADALLAQAEAGLRQADAQIIQAENSLVSAGAAVKQAEVALSLITLQLEKTQISSPISGVVLSKAVEAGEMIGGGFTALTIGNLADLTVTVYLPEDRYGQIDLGDLADLSVDSFPDQTFEAEVVYISDQAEYTPRNVQTQEERQNTVYAVKLRVINTDGILKPGMPADVLFHP